MLVDLGLTKHQKHTLLLPQSDKLQRLSQGCYILDTLIACQLQRRPYLKTADIHHIGLSNVDGIEEWESWHLESSDSSSMPPSPAKVLSCFSTFVQQVSLLNDFIHFLDNTIDHQSGRNMIQDIIRLGTPHFPSQSASLTPEPTPQSLNILFATTSFSRFLWSSLITLPGFSDPSPSAMLPTLPETFNQQLQENHQKYSTPLYDIYLQLCTNGNRLRSSQQNNTEKIKSPFKAILDLLNNERNFTAHTLDQASIGDHLAPAVTSDTVASIESMGAGGNDLYQSLITLDDADWYVVPRPSQIFLYLFFVENI